MQLNTKIQNYFQLFFILGMAGTTGGIRHLPVLDEFVVIHSNDTKNWNFCGDVYGHLEDFRGIFYCFCSLYFCFCSLVSYSVGKPG